MSPLLIQALVLGGCGFAVGVIVGLVLGWRARRNVARDLAQDVDRRVEASMRKYGVAPKVWRQ